jgi:hypothetical protein
MLDVGIEQNPGLGFSLDSLEVLIIPIIIIIVVIFGIYLILLLVRRILISGRILPGVYQQKVFMLTVPPRSSDEEDKKKNTKELLSSIENLYANLGGMRADRGFRSWMFGRKDSWSFEMVIGSDKLITFYIAIPQYLQDHFHQQILAHYPACQIEEITDYNIFSKQGAVTGAYLKLLKDKMFPILTYKSMEIDPMVAVLGAMAKLPEGHSVAVQFVMRSAKGEWRKRGVKVVSEMLQGKNLSQAGGSAVSGGGVIGALGRSSYKYWFDRDKDKASPVEPQQNYRLSPMEEQMAKSIEEKASRAGMDVNIRVVASAPTEVQAKEVLRQVTQSFAQYSNYEYANGFKAVLKGNGTRIINDFIYRNFNESISCVLNTEEMVSLWHLPLPHTDVPNIKWLQSIQASPPVNMPTEGLLLGENLYRGEQTLVKIKDGDRRRHTYVVGMTGTGKSWFMANLVVQDIRAGKGVAVVDPHGSLVEDIMPYIPKERLKDVVYFNPADVDKPIGLNMLEATNQQEMDFAASEMIAIFYKLLPDPSMAGPMFEHYMRNALLLLMADYDNPGTMVELARVFTDTDFRNKKLIHVKDILVKDFWEREYPASQKGSTGADMLSYVISKTGKFIENEMMRNIIGQAKSGINFRQVMDEGKILLMNLSKGKVGEMNSNLLGLITVSKLQMAAMARADTEESQRKDFYLYIDEFQNFLTDSISIILAEARKYKLNLIMAHQYIAQLTQKGDSSIRDAIFGNVGNLVSFRIGVDDSEIISKQMGPEVTEYDLLNIEKYNAYVRMLVDNTATDAFNMHAFPLPDDKDNNAVTVIKEYSRNKYGKGRDIVMSEIITRSKIGQLGDKLKTERPASRFGSRFRRPASASQPTSMPIVDTSKTTRPTSAFGASKPVVKKPIVSSRGDDK